MKRFKWLITILFVFSLVVGCAQDQSISVKEEESPSSAEEVEGLVPNKEDVMTAFRFWVNKRAWQYGDDTYLDQETPIEIYYDDLSDNGSYKKEFDKLYEEDYGERDEWDEWDEWDEEDEEDYEEWYKSLEEYRKEYYHGYVYYPLKKNKKGKVIYIEVSFQISKTGFATRRGVDEVSEIDEDLTYLGKETFYFKSTDVSIPEYPVSSPIKERFIEMVKENISYQILYNAREGHLIPPALELREEDRLPEDPWFEKIVVPGKEKVLVPGKYEVYIENFREEESEVYAGIKNEDGELFYCIFSAQQLSEIAGWEYCTIKELETKEDNEITAWSDGIISNGHWSDKQMRKQFQKTMQIAVSDFEVVVPE